MLLLLILIILLLLGVDRPEDHEQDHAQDEELLLRRQDAAGYFTESDSITVALGPAGDCQAIAILEPFPGLAVRQGQRVRAAPGQFQHAATRFLRRTADRSARQQVARLKVAA